MSNVNLSACGLWVPMDSTPESIIVATKPVAGQPVELGNDDLGAAIFAAEGQDFGLPQPVAALASLACQLGDLCFRISWGRSDAHRATPPKRGAYNHARSGKNGLVRYKGGRIPDFAANRVVVPWRS